MSHALPPLLLGVCTIFGLVLVLLGLPGLWVMVAGVVGYGWLTDFRSVGVATIAVVLGLAFLGEIIEACLGFRFARTFGGSRRSAWGALVGGIVGAVMGVPVPIVGSVIGAFLGSFVGAALFEYSLSRAPETAVRAGGGAVVGRAGFFPGHSGNPNSPNRGGGGPQGRVWWVKRFGGRPPPRSWSRPRVTTRRAPTPPPPSSPYQPSRRWPSPPAPPVPIPT